MFQYLYSVFATGLYQKIWLKLLIVFSIVVLVVFMSKHFIKNPNENMEGFSQKEGFLLKYEENIYDKFYVDTYDKIHKPQLRTPYEVNAIIKITQPDNKSNILDVGSGTGYIVNELNELGYSVYGVDKSPVMVDYSREKYPDLMIKQGDIRSPMLYDKFSFSHVLCLYYTIYDFKNKTEFFKNAYNWLKPGGYLVLHLVEPSKFDINVPAAKHVLFGSPQELNRPRSTDSVAHFDDFKYRRTYKFNQNKETMVTETFTDVYTGNIRQNEFTMYMEDITSIVAMANYVGFIPHGKIDMEEFIHDKHQYLYIFERPM